MTAVIHGCIYIVIYDYSRVSCLSYHYGYFFFWSRRYEHLHQRGIKLGYELGIIHFVRDACFWSGLALKILRYVVHKPSKILCHYFKTMFALKATRLASYFSHNRVHFLHTGQLLPANGTNQSSVIISQSECIYHNLSLEDWLYERWEPSTGQQVLLMWRNKPCIVIGKFQNQWKECNIGKLSSHRVQLGGKEYILKILVVNFGSLGEYIFSIARRKSGGGAVYHDLGNINMSFITHRDDYNRKKNLSFVCQVLKDRWPHLNLSINCRDDIIINDIYKVILTKIKSLTNSILTGIVPISHTSY